MTAVRAERSEVGMGKSSKSTEVTDCQERGGGVAKKGEWDGEVVQPQK